MNSIDFGKSVLSQEAEALETIAKKLGGAFATAVQMILECKGRVITCGLGKSGHIARKTAGTLASTGTSSFFLHAAEATHGDLGIIRNGDIVLLYTHSGETEEIVKLFPSIAILGAKTILITGRPDSSAGRLANICLNTHVKDEACPYNLAPTTSTTAMLALSDALALAVMDRRGFSKEDYARLHPGGTLGKRLTLTVADIMRKGADLALVSPDATVIDVMKAITKAGAGAACVVDPEQRFLGFVSEGDVRRHLLNSQPPHQLEGKAKEIMSKTGWSIEPDLLAVEALEAFHSFPKKIAELPVLRDGKVIGMLMLKDLLASGIV